MVDGAQRLVGMSLIIADLMCDLFKVKIIDVTIQKVGAQNMSKNEGNPIERNKLGHF